MEKEGQFHSKRGLHQMIEEIHSSLLFYSASSVSCLSLGQITMAGGGGKGQIALKVLN